MLGLILFFGFFYEISQVLGYFFHFCHSFFPSTVFLLHFSLPIQLSHFPNSNIFFIFVTVCVVWYCWFFPIWDSILLWLISQLTMWSGTSPQMYCFAYANQLLILSIMVFQMLRLLIPIIFQAVVMGLQMSFAHCWVDYTAFWLLVDSRIV